MGDFLAVEAGIRQLHARYVDAVWRKDAEAFGDCWTENAQWRLRGQLYQGRPEIMAFFDRCMDNYNRVIMTFRTPMIEIRQDGSVRARTYVTEQNGFKSGRPGSTIGIYFEQLVATAGQWRRDWALFQLHYIGPADLTGSFFEHPDYGPPPGFPPLDLIPPDYSRIEA